GFPGRQSNRVHSAFRAKLQVFITSRGGFALQLLPEHTGFAGGRGGGAGPRGGGGGPNGSRWGSHTRSDSTSGPEHRRGDYRRWDSGGGEASWYEAPGRWPGDPGVIFQGLLGRMDRMVTEALADCCGVLAS